MRLSYELVDVFTSQPFSGNPLAVVLDADGLSTAQLQAIAAEFNLSETAFPVAAPSGATYGLRIFTPLVEVPFAGHPSVGAAWVLRTLGRISEGPNVQGCGAGLLPVHLDADMVTLTGGIPSVSEPVDPAPLLASLGLDLGDLVGTAPRWASTGLSFAFLHVHLDALSKARVDVAKVAALGESGISLVAWDGQVARARVFPCGLGISEDPATGSAALGLGVFLAASGLLEDGVCDYVVEQGREMGRPSTLSCTVTVVGGRAVSTTVSGSVVSVGQGEISVPSA